MKLGRLLCKLRNPVTDYIINFLETKTTFITRLDEGPSNFSKSPLGAGFEYTLMAIVMTLLTAISVAITAAMLGGVGFGVWYFFDIVAFLFLAVTTAFALLFMAFYWLGFAFCQAYAGTIWLFTNEAFWYSISSWAVYLLAWLLAIGVMAILLCLLCIGICKLPFLRSFGAFLTSALNGFTEAQAARKARKSEAIRKLPPWECIYCGYKSNLAENSYCLECTHIRPKPESQWGQLFDLLFIWIVPVGWFVNQIFSIGVKIKDREIDVIGPLGIFWSYLVAIKHGVCPIVEFVDPAQLQADARRLAQERMEREAEAKRSKLDSDA